MSTIQEFLKTITGAIDNFQEAIPAVQKLIYKRIEPLIKELETKNGKLLNNLKNLKLIGSIKNEIQRIIITPEYKAAVNTFIDSYEEISNLQAQYFSQFMTKYKPAKVLPLIKELAVETTINDLVGQGMKASIVDPIMSIITQNITTGGSYADFNEQLRNEIISNGAGEGSMLRYTRQITTDAINQYAAQNAEAIAQDLKFDWMEYVGSLLTTSREFCIHLVEKRWIHRSELMTIISGNIDGHQLKLSKRTKLPLGMIPGTTPENFNIRRGGYLCGHQAFWVPNTAVPFNIRGKLHGSKPPDEKVIKKLKEEVKQISEWVDGNGNIVDTNNEAFLSVPGNEQKFIAPNGQVVTGKVKQVSIDSIRATEAHALDENNGTAEGYASGEFSLFDKDGKEISVKTRKLTDPNQLPPVLVSKDGWILDGHNRYAAAFLFAKLKFVNIIQVDKTYKEFYGQEVPDEAFEWYGIDKVTDPKLSEPTVQDMLSLPSTLKILEDMDWGMQFMADPKNFKKNTYYRVEGTGLGYTGVGQGLYVGRDKKALKSFYDIEDQGLEVLTFKGDPKWLNLMDPDTMAAFEKKAIAKFGESTKDVANHMRSLALEMGYDGIMYFDASATGQEFVLFNTDKLVKVESKKPVN